MKQITRLWTAGILTALLSTGPAMAALKVGTPAPDVEVEAALAGKAYHFSLDEALKSGPVVLYFYPAAFTPGCTVEANEFAEATDSFKALGATVIGVSADKIDKLKEFSTSECRNKFSVAADPEQKVIKAYDAVLERKPEYADRISYVITPDKQIYFVHKGLEPVPHVEHTLKAVELWAQSQKENRKTAP